MLGTNGGGFFNANSAHPFENPTPLINFLQMLSIFAIPRGLTYTLGPHDRLRTPRLGCLGGHGSSISRRRHHCLLGRSSWQSACSRESISAPA